MNYPEYKADLQRIHESEVYGSALFKTAAQLTWNESQKRKWLRLKDLEDRTLERYLDYMRETAQAVTGPIGWDLKGYAEGAALGLLPWTMAMKQLADDTLPFQEKFLRLKNNATCEKDKKFFGYIYAHEKVIEYFAKKEIAGDANSLTAVEHLLNAEDKRQPEYD